MVPIAMTALAALSAGCTGGDSTVSKTPTNTIASPSGSAPATAHPRITGTTSTTPARDPCAVNLNDPAIASAVALLPPAPNSNAGWKPKPVAGNYNKCAPLSAVIVAADTPDPHPGTRAVFFHEGNVVTSGVSDTYGYNGIDLTLSTPDTVVLNFSNGIPGLDSVVSFHWNGTGIEVLQRPVQ